MVHNLGAGQGYICATEAFNKGMTSSRRQECHYFGHLHPFQNVVRKAKHGSGEVPINNDLKMT